MIRLDEKESLILKVCDIYSSISKYSGRSDPNDKSSGKSKYLGCIPKKMKKLADKSILKDFKKGLKIIEKKNPIYIEMPTLKTEGNGMYSEDYSKTCFPKQDKEIIVNSPVLSTTQSQAILDCEAFE